MGTRPVSESPHERTDGTTPLSDEEIVDRVRGGDTGLYEILVRRHNRRLYRVARAILGGDADAEDVMQDAYVRAFERLGQFRGEARFATWLTRIAINEARLRLRRRRPLVEIDAMDDDGNEPLRAVPAELRSRSRGADHEAFSRQLAALLDEAIEALPLIYRSVFVLRQVEGLSVAETAACLEVGEDVVRTRLHRARALLRDALFERTGASCPDAFQFHLDRCSRVVAGVLGRIAR